jgi:hypothetical protein
MKGGVSIAVLRIGGRDQQGGWLSHLVWIEGCIEVLGSNPTRRGSLIKVELSLFNYKVLSWDR